MTDVAGRIRASFDKQTMMATLGVRLDGADVGGVVISAPILASSLQQHGAGHAALTFALGDSAEGYAALTILPESAEVMTAEIKINLMSPAVGDRLVAEGRVIRAGRRLIVVASDVWAETATGRRHVAMMQGTMISVPADTSGDRALPDMRGNGQGARPAGPDFRRAIPCVTDSD